MSGEKQYSIGQLSKLTGISITALRYYDGEGVLIPEIRNKKSGYRYYSGRQLVRAQIIRDLKPLGLTLEEIKSFLDGQDEKHLERCLFLKMSEIEQEIEHLEDKLLSTQNAYHRITGGHSLINSVSDISRRTGNYYPVEVMPLMEMWVLYTRYLSRLDVNELFSDRCLELQHLRSEYNLFPAGPYIAIFHGGYQTQFSSGRGDLELCLPIIKPNGFHCKELRNLGEMLTASTIHIGSYCAMEQTYRYLEEWIKENRYRITGAPMEYYLMDIGNTLNEEQYITKIHFPVEII